MKDNRTKIQLNIFTALYIAISHFFFKGNKRANLFA